MARKELKLCDDEIEQIEKLASVLSQDQLADFFGISRRTFIAMKAKDERIDALYKKGRARAIASVASNLLNQAKKGNITAIIFYLKTQANWKEKEPDDIERKDPISINFIGINGNTLN